MKLKLKPRQKPIVGDTRVKRKFLWLPRIINNELRFWETATWQEEFKPIDYYLLNKNQWVPEEWID